MSDVCTCPAAGYCTRRNTRVNLYQYQLCQKGKVLQLDKMFEGRAANVAEASRYCPASPSVSVLLLKGIETATGRLLPDGDCRQYLVLLDSCEIHDAEDIVKKLAVELPLPAHIQEQYTTQQKRQEWLRPFVEDALITWVNIPDATQP